MMLGRKNPHIQSNIPTSTMAQIILLAALLSCLLVTVLAEPPVSASSQYGPPLGLSGQYGVPGRFGGPENGLEKGGYSSGGFSASGNGGDDNAEPANYEFQYDVEASDYGVKLGHQETRQGEVAQGKYYVLLPDGRTQVVEYVADQDGYRPKISYMENENGSNGQNGYSRDRPDGRGGLTNAINEGGYSNAHTTNQRYSSGGQENHDGYSFGGHNQEEGYFNVGSKNNGDNDQEGYKR